MTTKNCIPFSPTDLPLIVSAWLSYEKSDFDFGNIPTFPTRGNAEYQNILQQAFNIENTRKFFSMYPQNSETQKVKAIREQV